MQWVHGLSVIYHRLSSEPILLLRRRFHTIRCTYSPVDWYGAARGAYNNHYSDRRQKARMLRCLGIQQCSSKRRQSPLKPCTASVGRTHAAAVLLRSSLLRREHTQWTENWPTVSCNLSFTSRTSYCWDILRNRGSELKVVRSRKRRSSPFPLWEFRRNPPQKFS